jgi:hypothetical protein
MEIESDGRVYVYHIGPTSVSVNGKWYFITKTLDCDDNIFGREYCGMHSIDVLIASLVHNIGAM